MNEQQLFPVSMDPMFLLWNFFQSQQCSTRSSVWWTLVHQWQVWSNAVSCSGYGPSSCISSWKMPHPTWCSDRAVLEKQAQKEEEEQAQGEGEGTVSAVGYHGG